MAPCTFFMQGPYHMSDLLRLYSALAFHLNKSLQALSLAPQGPRQCSAKPVQRAVLAASYCKANDKEESPTDSPESLCAIHTAQDAWHGQRGTLASICGNSSVAKQSK